MSDSNSAITEYSTAVGDAFNTTGDDGREDGTVEDMLALLEYVNFPVSFLDYLLTSTKGKVLPS